jgi:hypothetical protein
MLISTRPTDRPKAVGGDRVEDLDDVLHFEVVVAGAERAHGVALALAGVLRDRLGVGAGDAAALLDALEVGALAIALGDGPARPAGEHGGHLAIVQADGAGAADPGGHGGEQRVGELGAQPVEVRQVEAGVQGAHAAGHVEAHPAGGHHAALVRVEGRDPADGETVAPVGVRHRVGCLHDTRQLGDVGGLFCHFVVHVGHQLGAAVDHGGHPHAPAGREPPGGVGESFEALQVHVRYPVRTAPAIARRPRGAPPAR